jgi:septum formation protein
MKIVLGSKSKVRQEILSSMGYEFEVHLPSFDEKSVRSEDPKGLTRLLARGKSAELQKQIHHPVILITVDSVAVYKNKIREKPIDEDEAREFLRSYAHGPAEVVTSVFVVNTGTGKTAIGTESAKVYFHAIPERLIDDLISHGAVMHAAGGFIVEMPAIKKYVVHTEGNLDTVMGLPKILTKQLIEKVS